MEEPQPWGLLRGQHAPGVPAAAQATDMAAAAAAASDAAAPGAPGFATAGASQALQRGTSQQHQDAGVPAAAAAASKPRTKHRPLPPMLQAVPGHFTEAQGRRLLTWGLGRCWEEALPADIPAGWVKVGVARKDSGHPDRDYYYVSPWGQFWRSPAEVQRYLQAKDTQQQQQQQQQQQEEEVKQHHHHQQQEQPQRSSQRTPLQAWGHGVTPSDHSNSGSSIRSLSPTPEPPPQKSRRKKARHSLKHRGPHQQLQQEEQEGMQRLEVGEGRASSDPDASAAMGFATAGAAAAAAAAAEAAAAPGKRISPLAQLMAPLQQLGPLQQQQRQEQQQQPPTQLQQARLDTWTCPWQREPNPEGLPPGWITVRKYMPGCKVQLYYMSPEGCASKGLRSVEKFVEKYANRPYKPVYRERRSEVQQQQQQQQQGPVGNASEAAAAAAAAAAGGQALPVGALQTGAGEGAAAAAADGAAAAAAAPAPTPAPAAEPAAVPQGVAPQVAAREPAAVVQAPPAAEPAAAGAGAAGAARGVLAAPATWLRPPEELGQDVGAMVQEVRQAMEHLQLSPDQRRGLRKFLLAITACPQPERRATFVRVQYPLLYDSQEGGAEEVVEALCTLVGLPLALPGTAAAEAAAAPGLLVG